MPGYRLASLVAATTLGSPVRHHDLKVFEASFFSCTSRFATDVKYSLTIAVSVKTFRLKSGISISLNRALYAK
jgi:hypothetical protein